MAKYTLKKIRSLERSVDPWAYTLVLRHLVIRIVWLLGNHTNFTPNQITCISFIFGIFSAISFLQGTVPFLILGAFLFEISYIFDCVDGRIARLKGQSSMFGRYLDSMSDQMRVFLAVLCLTYGQYAITNNDHYFLFGMTYLFFYLLYSISESLLPNAEDNKKSRMNKTSFAQRITLFLHLRHLSPLLSYAEADTIVFFIFPILNRVNEGLLIGSFIIINAILIRAYFNRKRVGGV